MALEYVFGFHAVNSVLKQHGAPTLSVVRLWVLEGRRDQRMTELLLLAKDRNIRFEYASRDQLDLLVTPGARHQGVVAQVQRSATSSVDVSLEALLAKETPDLLLLILDGVQDPHNLGACLRTADAAGVHAVIAPKDRAVSINPTVKKVACGAAETVPFIQVTNLATAMRQIQESGVWITGAAGEAEKTLYDIDFKGRVAIVMGAEGEGMRRLTREHCDELVNIPMAGSVESLNVSVATGVCLYEVVRQRRLVKR